MISLRARLSAGLAVSLVAVFALQWAVVVHVVRQVAEHYVATRLEHDMHGLLAAVTVDADGGIGLAEQSLPLLYNQPLSGHYYRITDGTRVLRSRSLWDHTLEAPAPGFGELEVRRLPGPAHQRLLLTARGFRKQATSLVIAVAEDVSGVDAEIARFRLRYALLSGAALLVLVAAQQWVVGRGLRPLGRLREELVRLERGEVEALEVSVPAEVAPLVAEVNRLMAVMTRRLARSREALGNLAHALKGPLTLLTRAAEEPPAAGAQAALAEHTAAIRRLVDRELKRARLAGEAPGTRFQAERELPALADTVARLYRDRGLRFDLDIERGAALAADREDMLELAGNLLDNACKWAASRVRLGVRAAPDFRLTVEDDGPGCPPEQFERLTARGVRLDEAREGHGLGLAIARDIVAHYGGSLAIDRSPALGGLRVEVRLPGPVPA